MLLRFRICTNEQLISRAAPKWAFNLLTPNSWLMLCNSSRYIGQQRQQGILVMEEARAQTERVVMAATVYACEASEYPAAQYQVRYAELKAQAESDIDVGHRQAADMAMEMEEDHQAQLAGIRRNHEHILEETKATYDIRLNHCWAKIQRLNNLHKELVQRQESMLRALQAAHDKELVRATNVAHHYEIDCDSFERDLHEESKLESNMARVFTALAGRYTTLERQFNARSPSEVPSAVHRLITSDDEELIDDTAHAE